MTKFYNIGYTDTTRDDYNLYLPALTGSFRQIKWATNIRENFLNRLQRYTNDTAFYDGLQNLVNNITSSKTWIEDINDLTTQEQRVAKVTSYLADTETTDTTETETETETDKLNDRGVSTQLLAAVRIDENITEITGIRFGKTERTVTTRRKEMTNTSFPGEILVNFNTDVYAFTYNDEYKAERIHWVGNYKQNIWSEETTDEQKAAVGGNTTPNPQDNTEIYHETYTKILACVQSDIPVYLVGPAGSGKNFTLEQVARQLNMKFYFTNSVQQEHKLTGFIDAGGRYHETEFYKAFTNGGLFFLDEMDASIPEVLVLLNAAIANGYFEFPNGRAHAHSDFRVVAAGNTMGSGADELYTGRLVLDQATLDRFCIIEFDYDIRVEMKVANGNIELVNFVRDLRAQSESLGIRATYSYRCIISATKLEGILSIEEIVKIAIVKGLDTDTLKTYKTEDSNKYSRALYKIQRAS